MYSRTKQVVAGTAAVAALALGGTAIAGATGAKTAQNGTAAGQPRPGETALTGETAEKVKAAALAELPGGTVLRVETDRGGIYEAHVRKADGTEVEVKVDKAFAVTAVEEHGRP
jgi:uncharacterized membrane protein YkoI